MGVVVEQQEDERGFVEWASGEPGSIVRGRVGSYTGYREASSTMVRRVETPAGNLNLIVSFGDEFFAPATAGAGALSTYTSFAVGMHDRPSRTAHNGRQLGIQVGLDPYAAFSLLGMSSCRLEAVEFRFVGVDGPSRTTSLDNVDGAEVVRGGPVRSLPAYRGQRNYPGLLWTAMVQNRHPDIGCLSSEGESAGQRRRGLS